jgi:CDP-paratose 2-epimerase
MIHQASGKKPQLTYSEQNRIGDHICYYSDLSKFRRHYPQWKLTYSLPQIVGEMVRSMSAAK